VRLLETRCRSISRASHNDAASAQEASTWSFLTNDIEVIPRRGCPRWCSLRRRPRLGAGVGEALVSDTTDHACGDGARWQVLAAMRTTARDEGTTATSGRASLTQSLSPSPRLPLLRRKYSRKSADSTRRSRLPSTTRSLPAHPGLRVPQSYTPYAQLYHHESASRGYEDTPDKMGAIPRRKPISMRARWMPVLDEPIPLTTTPTWSPLEGMPFALSWPPRVESFKPQGG
jgi:hypothetical protein